MHAPTLFSITSRLALGLVLASATWARADAYDDVDRLIKANSLEAALAKAEAYLSTKPADPQMRFLKGMVERAQNKLEAALQTFTNLTEEYPELAEPHNNLAVLYAARGQYQQAQKALEMAIKAKPDYAAAHENLADVHVRLAQQAYQHVGRLEPQNARAAQKLKMAEQLLKPQQGSSR